MSFLNSVNFQGNLTKDVELKYMPSGVAVANISVAINETYLDKTTKEKIQKVSFIEVKFFAKTAENLNKFFKKGDQIIISGKLNQETWKTEDGQNRSKIVIIGNSWFFCNGRKDENNYPKPPEVDDKPQSKQQSSNKTNVSTKTVDEEDIPF